MSTRLALGSDDPLDDGLLQKGVLPQHHDVAVFVLVIQQGGEHHQPVPVLQGRHHGVAVHPDEPDPQR